MSKQRDIKKGLMGLQLDQAMKLKGSSLSLSPPAAHVAGVSKETADVNSSSVKHASVDQIPTQDSQRSTVGIGTEVKCQTQDAELSQVSFATRDKKRSLGEKPTQVEKVTQVQIPSRDRNSTPVQNASLDKSASVDALVSLDGSEPRIVWDSGSRKATEQDSSAVLVKKENQGLRAGFTRISNEMLLDILEGDMSKAEIKILLLISRFTTSFQKEFAPLSKAVIEKFAGLHGKSVLDAMDALESKKLIQKQKGDARSPSRLALAKKYSVAAFSKAPPDKISTRDQEVAPVEISPVDRFAPNNKDNKNINKYSLSQISEELREYFAGVIPKAKRDEEFLDFENLRKECSEADLLDCFRHLKKHGALKTGDPVHSPMAYLSKAFSQVLAEVHMNREKALVSERLARAQREEDERKKREDELAEREAQQATQEFEHRFPDAASREQKLDELVRSHFPGSTFGKSILRRIVVVKWFQTEVQATGGANA